MKAKIIKIKDPMMIGKLPSPLFGITLPYVTQNGAPMLYTEADRLWEDYDKYEIVDAIPGMIVSRVGDIQLHVVDVNGDLHVIEEIMMSSIAFDIVKRAEVVARRVRVHPEKAKEPTE